MFAFGSSQNDRFGGEEGGEKTFSTLASTKLVVAEKGGGGISYPEPK